MDASLYGLALSMDRPPQPLAVSPATLLSLVKSVIDLLLEQQVSAQIWLKLPPGDVWLSEIQRYHEVALPHAIYTCSLQTKNSQKVMSGVGDQLSVNNVSSAAQNSSVIPLQLSATSQLRREYFLLVLSPQFCGLILAHRTRRRRPTKLREKSNRKKRQALLAVCSFEREVIRRVLDGIKNAIALNQSSTTPADLLANWDSLFTIPLAPEPVLVDQFFAKQIQQHEQARRSATSNRVTALRLQNQEMVDTLNLKDELLSNLCQELRTPLTNMKTALSLLNSPMTLKPAQRQRYMQLLNTECDRQNSLITGLLDLAQLERVAEQTAMQPVLLSDVVPGVVSTYQPLAQEKGIMLAYTVPTDLPAVSCLNSWLKQIVINLLHNSIKFTPTGGHVWVLARLQGDYIQLEFRDTGIGIAPNEVPKVFDRFYRIRPVAEDSAGAGLGLTIVQKLLWRCGGSVSVKSRLGEGSSFNVLLPVAHAQT